MNFSKAEAWERSGRADLAIHEYSAIIEAREGGASALLRRAMLRREMGELADAQRDLEHAASIAPDDPYPLMRLGHLAHTVGRNVKAAEYQLAAVARAGDNAEMRVNAAAACMHVDWLDLAYAAAKPLREGLSDWWAATRAQALEQYPAARAAAIATLRSRRGASDQAAVCWELIQQLSKVGRLRMAKRLCNWLMRDRPYSFPAFALYARIIARDAGAEAAVAFLEAQAWPHGAEPDYAYALARMYQEVGRYEDVLKTSSSVSIERQNDDFRYTTLIATMLLGRDGELNDHCQAWSRLSPDSITPPGFLCAAHFRNTLAADPEEAVGGGAATLFHFWDSADIPDDVRTVMASWSHHHPSARQYVFNEEDARDYLRSHYGAASVSIFDRCSHAAMKADLFRVAYLAQDGGLWVDADEACLRPVPELLAAAGASEAMAVLSGDVPAYLHNFFLGARPGSRIMAAAVDDALSAIDHMLRDGRRPNIWQVTGPGLITRMVGRSLARRDATDTAPIRLLALTHYRSFAANRSDLDYKRSIEGNWQLL